MHGNKNPVKKKVHRNRQIDGLRGVAITFILVYHVVNRYQQIYFNQSVRWMDFWGTFGVTIFFMISSFYFVKHENRIMLKEGAGDFFEKITRLWPSYFLSITVIYFVTDLFKLEGRSVSGISYICNIFFLNRPLNLPYVDGAHWYLGVLLSSYIIICIINILGIQRKPITYIIWNCLGLIIYRHTSNENLFHTEAAFAGCLCMGISLFFINDLKDKKDNKSECLKWGAVGVISLLCTFASRGLVCLLEQLLVSVVLICCVNDRIKLFECKLLCFLGKISYSLYLIHQNISFVIQQQLSILMVGYRFINMIISLIVVLTIGTIFFFYFEKPVQRFIITIRYKHIR